MTDNELNDHLARQNEECARREKLGYEGRQRQVASDNEDARGQQGKHFKQTGAIDLTTFTRMEQNDPGFWDDKKSRDSFMRDNPECRVQRD